LDQLENENMPEGGEMLSMTANSAGGSTSPALSQKSLDFQALNLQMFGYSNYKYLLKANGQDFFAKYDD